MSKIALSPAFVDQRGVITDLLNDVSISSVGLVTSKAGVVRGNKYHLREDKYIYIMRGKLEWVSRAHGSEEIETVTYQTGDFFLVPALTEHAMRFIEDSEMIQLTTESRAGSGYEDDTCRLETPLIAPSI